MTQPWLYTLPGLLEVFYKILQNLLCFLLTDSVSDSAFEKDELVLDNRQLDYAVREVERKEARE